MVKNICIKGFSDYLSLEGSQTVNDDFHSSFDVIVYSFSTVIITLFKLFIQLVK